MSSRYISLTLVVVATLACLACAAQQKTDQGNLQPKGYSEIWLDQRDLQVDFKGAPDDPVDRLKKLAILRAAEIGQGRRFDRFVIVQTGDQFIIDGVRKSGDDLLPVEKLKVIVVVKFVVKGEPEYEQAFDIRGKIEEIKKESATKRIEGSNGGR